MAQNVTWIPNYWFNFIEHSSDQHMTDWGRWMRLVGLPLALLIGFPGNALSVAVMSREKMRHHSYSIILQTLAIFDSISLIIRLLFWINLLMSFFGREALVTIRSVVACKASEYLFTSIHIVCSWLVVAISMERFIVVWLPIKSRQWCTPKSSRIATLSLVAFAFSLQIYSAVLTEYVPHVGCVMTQNHMYVHFIVATTFVTFAPLILIFISNIGIIVCLWRSKRLGKASTRDIAMRKVTNMLLAVSCAFLLLVFPNALVVLLMGLRQDWRPVLGIILEPLALLWDINFAINFYIYVLSGKEVRHEVREMLGCCRPVCRCRCHCLLCPPFVGKYSLKNRETSLDLDSRYASSSLSTPSTASTVSINRNTNERF